MQNLRIGLGQINCVVGDLKSNTRKICEFIKKAKDLDVDIISFPEMAIPGYPPEDLLLKPQFIRDNLRCLSKIKRFTENITAIIGFVDCRGNKIYNAAAVIHNEVLIGIYHKMYLPNYGVFDEKRYFQPGERPVVFVFGEVTFGVNICEDIWRPEGPTENQILIGGAQLIFNISASPYYTGKLKDREKILARRAGENGAFIAYNNLVGGQDELVFDGGGMIFDRKGNLINRAKRFDEDLIIADLDINPRRSARVKNKKEATKVKKIIISKRTPVKKRKPLSPPERINDISLIEEVYNALVLGVKDYVRKNGFQKVIIGLSGGIDSSLSAVIAVDALGKNNVIGIFMSSVYSSRASRDDAEILAVNLGIKFITIPINSIFQAYLIMLEQEFTGTRRDVTEENLQARIRGNIVMALSNKFGWLVLTTGNKSEMSVGYATLYGDMAGGFAVIKDVPKTLVYELSGYRNSISLQKAIIPRRVFEKEPAAELKPNQKDSDTLPPYGVLDSILKAYVEEDKNFKEIIARGYKKEVVGRIIDMVDKSEYKRRQAPLGIKITPKAFGRDRRMPITNRYIVKN